MAISERKSPFLHEELMPQEEVLEISTNKNNYSIGILKESTENEKRIPLSPIGVEILVDNSFKVYVERGAGKQANFDDVEYSEAGAFIVEKSDVFQADIILKISLFTDEEIALLDKRHIIFSTVNINEVTKDYILKLIAKRVTAISYELIKDRYNTHPIVQSMSEIAGSASILIAAELLSSNNSGKGEMLGGVSGVKPTEIVIIGAGTAGEHAASTALGLGAEVKLFDTDTFRLRSIQKNLGRKLFTSLLIDKLLKKSLLTADVVIAALRHKPYEYIISEDIVKQMKKNSVIIDLGIDNGGFFETSEMTSHAKPFYKKHNVIHYCVPNIPSRVARTASYAMSNIITNLLRDSASSNIKTSIKNNPGLRNGVYIFQGILTCNTLADAFDMPFKDINLLLAAF